MIALTKITLGLSGQRTVKEPGEVADCYNLYPDIGKPMVLYIDASDQRIGAVLTQPRPYREGPVPSTPEEVPVYFLSNRLTKTGRI